MGFLQNPVANWYLSSVLPLMPLASYQSYVWDQHHAVPIDAPPQVNSVDTDEEFIPVRQLQKAPGQGKGREWTHISPSVPSLMERTTEDTSGIWEL